MIFSSIQKSQKKTNQRTIQNSKIPPYIKYELLILFQNNNTDIALLTIISHLNHFLKRAKG